jgi:hypothetical protein
MKEAGFVVDHEHNHCGRCWWEIRSKGDATPPSESGTLAGERDVRLRPDWKQASPPDSYVRATDPDEKTSPAPS